MLTSSKFCFMFIFGGNDGTRTRDLLHSFYGTSELYRLSYAPKSPGARRTSGGKPLMRARICTSHGGISVFLQTDLFPPTTVTCASTIGINGLKSRRCVRQPPLPPHSSPPFLRTSWFEVSIPPPHRPLPVGCSSHSIYYCCFFTPTIPCLVGSITLQRYR